MSKDGIKVLSVILSILLFTLTILWFLRLGDYFKLKNPTGPVGPHYERHLKEAKNWLIYQAWSTIFISSVGIASLRKAYKKAKK